jgi:hypothetical protein
MKLGTERSSGIVFRHIPARFEQFYQVIDKIMVLGLLFSHI